ncbi:dihydroorotate dehydrogenase (quinone), mitochondrial [Culicoides brevitarsis]|uniref:dihydroorotate dehydrogenase (quinone), mitochondrial n=1 Tax=Culicoides brevitarsis TaxID=469753 RepID=UPI00307BF602
MSAWKKFTTYVKVTGGAVLIFSGINIYRGNEKFYNDFVMPLNSRLPPEFSHKLAIVACKYNVFPKPKFEDSERLKVKLLNFNLKNPIGIAAGFDKQAEVPDKLLDLGFGFVEIGSVTPLPQPGNDKPRVFRLNEDKAIINRYGFNSDGHDVVFERMKDIRAKNDLQGLIGVNLGKNKTSEDPVEDYVKGVKKFAGVADYLVVNVSSPNTPGLRDMQHKDILYNLLKATIAARNELKLPNSPPIFLKLAPDLTKQELKEVTDTIKRKECKIDGLIISNTTISRDPELKSDETKETGGLSGAPLMKKSTKMIAEVYKMTGGKVPIIGVGGVFDGKDAYEKIAAGATTVQLYTAFAYHGPFVIPKIKKELQEILEQKGYKTVNDAVGKEADRFLS